MKDRLKNIACVCVLVALALMVFCKEAQSQELCVELDEVLNAIETHKSEGRDVDVTTAGSSIIVDVNGVVTTWVLNKDGLFCFRVPPMV